MPYFPRKLLQPVRGRIAGYALGIALFALGLAVRWAADHLFPPGFPFLTFFPAVIVATFLAGRGPGVLCAVLSGLAAWYFFVPPVYSFAVTSGVATAMLFYGFVVAVDIMLIDGLVHRQQRLEENEARLTLAAERERLLFKELQHRVANNLATVAAMLRMQRRQIAADPATALDAIDRANARIELMGEVHRQLYDPAALDLPLVEQIRRAADHARAVGSADHVRLDVEVADARLEPGRLMTVVLLISELLGNSFKHAFEDHSAPAVRVVIARTGDARLRLTVCDNGSGLPPEAELPQPRRGLGTAIIKGFVAQLGGTMTVESLGGVTTVVEFPEG
ncbi:sensor histidine kinase [Novosphingobium huizhouense]|uniref:sensor histidine kinase n=1 Tax=Novosphingobium huizhouense TaxID=2866625 RepID=UPI001CD8D107|nr:DUF4118 domain-containing protein [Novosphingobium huizhouense]